jgi:hypothetical protein
VSEETKTAPIGAPEVSETTEPTFEPGDTREAPERADMTDPDVARSFATPDRELEEDDDGEEREEPSWESIREVKEPQPKAKPVAKPAGVKEITEEFVENGVSDEEVAAVMAAAAQRKVIKNPFARARIAEKERDLAQEREARLESKLDRLTAAFEGKDKAGEKAGDPDEDLSPAEKILKELAEIKRERETEKKLAVAEGQLRSVSTIIYQRQQEDPVFVDAMNHIARVMARRVQKDDRFGKTEAEKKHNFAQVVLSEHLKIAEEGQDVVAWTYDKAEDFGFDIKAACRAHGVIFEGMDEKELFPEGLPKATGAPQSPAKGPARVDPRAEIAASRKRSEGTSTVSGLTGKPPKRFSAKNMMGKSDAEFRYEVKRAAAAGEISTDPKSGRVTYDDIMREVAEER